MKPGRSLLLLYLLLFLFVASCAPVTPAFTPTPEGTRILTIMTHDSFAVSEEVAAEFEAKHGVELRFLESGDAGEALNKAILAKGNPLGDVLYGVDNTFSSRALEEGIFEPYSSPLLEVIPDEFKLDPADGALPVDYGDVCVNYDKAYFREQSLPPPATLEDLAQPVYRDLLVVENPATSSPGLAFLLATVGHFGKEGYLDYWQALKDNGVKVVNDWETAYNAEFSGSAGKGPRPLVVSYGSSPPFEVLFAEAPLEEAPTGVVTGPGACFRQIEFVGILKGTPNRDLAEKWVDFMLSTRFQEDLPLQMFVFPVNPQAQLDEAFQKYLARPEQPAFVSPADIAANREEWIRDWTEVVLR